MKTKSYISHEKNFSHGAKIRRFFLGFRYSCECHPKIDSACHRCEGVNYNLSAAPVHLFRTASPSKLVVTHGRGSFLSWAALTRMNGVCGHG